MVASIISACGSWIGRLNKITMDKTFGEKAVGIDFNPSGDPKVARVKELFAEIIDTLVPDGDLDNGATGLKGRILGRAINDAIVAQMLAVKFLTFKD